MGEVMPPMSEWGLYRIGAGAYLNWAQQARRSKHGKARTARAIAKRLAGKGDA